MYLILKSPSITTKGDLNYWIWYRSFSKFRLWHMRHVISRAHLCTSLKHWRCAEKTMPWLRKLQGVQQIICLNNNIPYLSLSAKHKDLMTKSCEFICYFIDSVVKIVLSEAATRGVHWCNLTLAKRFWVTKVCLWASKISRMCLFGHLTGWATSWKANFENCSRYYLIKWYQFLSI